MIGKSEPSFCESLALFARDLSLRGGRNPDVDLQGRRAAGEGLKRQKPAYLVYFQARNKLKWNKMTSSIEF